MLGLKLPVPLLVHLPVVVIPPIVPLNATVGLFAQTEILTGPAFAVGALEIATFIVSLAKPQIPFAVEVKNNLTDPAAVSALLGKYVEFNAVLFGVKLPVPVLAQIPVEDAPDIFPFNKTALLFPQTIWSIDALTSGDGFTDNNNVSFC